MGLPDTYSSIIPLLAVLVSLAAVPFILLSSRRPNLREFWTIAASLTKFGLVISLLPSALTNKAAETSLFEISPGIRLALKADSFGVFFALIASGLWILTSFYSIGYVRGLSEHKQTRYFASFAISLSATIGVAFSANLLTFVLFYEILTIATYPLVIHKETKEAVHAGRKYLAYTLTAGLFLIAATAVTYKYTNNLDFQPGGLFGGASLSPKTIVILFLMFLAGVGVKASIMPLHSWLPTAMAAPTPVSALLHAVAVVKSGVFGVIRVVGFVFGPKLMVEYGLQPLLMAFAGTTIILASLLAFKQDNLKRRLAYSTVGHLSYIILGVSILSSTAIMGGLLHMAFHATLKITLFFCAGAIYVAHHKENVSQLDGIGKTMPWTMGAFTIGAIGLVGIPPLNGFLSKWYMSQGALDAGRMSPILILVLSGLLNAGYLFPIIQRAYFKPAPENPGKKEASPAMVIPLILTAILSFVLGLAPNLFFKFMHLAQNVAAKILHGVIL